MIVVTVNGQPREFEADGELPLPELVRRLEITHPRIAVAHNGLVLRREEHGATVIRDGDTVEIVRMVGGGAVESGVRSPESRVWSRPSVGRHARCTT